MATFTNQATLSYTGGSINSNIVTGEITETVTATKTAISAGYTPDGTVSYAVSIVNSGATDMTGITVTDDLGAYLVGDETVYPLAFVADSLLYFVDGVPAAAPTVTAGPPLTISGITVPALGNVMLIYEARVTEFAPLGEAGEITNTITVTGGCIVTPLTDSATISLLMAPRLSIAKSVSPAVLIGCDELTYTFVIQNAGSEAGADAGVVITDVFDPILRNLTVTLDGVTLPASAYTYDEATGLFTTVAGQITVPGATFEQNPDGSWMTTPGITVLTISGTIG
ncbi:MAG: hypothetical protein IJV41_04670 [Oscillospiraceae bacterium]|nr:hypothetical protein [Oscillospiraceae bacterium]